MQQLQTRRNRRTGEVQALQYGQWVTVQPGPPTAERPFETRAADPQFEPTEVDRWAIASLFPRPAMPALPLGAERFSRDPSPAPADGLPGEVASAAVAGPRGYRTDVDPAKHARLQAMFDAGAGFDDISRTSKELGIPVVERHLRRAINWRSENGGRTRDALGRGVQFLPDDATPNTARPSPPKTAEELNREQLERITRGQSWTNSTPFADKPIPEKLAHLASGLGGLLGYDARDRRRMATEARFVGEWAPFVGGASAIEQGGIDFERGDYLSGAINTGLGSLDFVPIVGPGTKLLRKSISGAPEFVTRGGVRAEATTFTTEALKRRLAKNERQPASQFPEPRLLSAKDLSPVRPGRAAQTLAEAILAARNFVGRPITNESTGLRATVSGQSLKKMTSQSAVAKSTTREDHALAVANVDALFPLAKLAERYSDAEGEPTIIAISRYIARMNADGRDLLVKLTVKETASPRQPNPIYTVEAVKVEPDPKAPQSGIEAEPGRNRFSARAGSAVLLAEEPMAGKEVLGELGRAGVAALKTPRDIRRALAVVERSLRGLNEAERVEVTGAAIGRLAADLGIEPIDLWRGREGRGLNSEQAVQASRILASSADELIALAGEARGGSIEKLAEFQRALLRNAAIQEQISGTTLGAGPMLARFKMLDRANKGRSQLLLRMVDAAGGKGRLEELADAILERQENRAELSRLIRAGMQPGRYGR